MMILFNNIIIFLSIIIICIFVVYILEITIFKKRTFLFKEAKRIVKENLSKRPSVPIEDLFDSCGIPEHLRENSTIIINALGGILKQETNKIKYNESLSEILKIKKSEFDSSLYDTWDKQGLKDDLEIFGYDIYSFFEKNADIEKLIKAYENMNNQPKNEDAEIDFILDLKICELLHFFAPLINANEKNS